MVRPQSLDEAARNCRRRVGWSWTGSVAVDMAECRLDFETMHSVRPGLDHSYDYVCLNFSSVPARLREARHVPDAHRVGVVGEYDRDGLSRLSGRLDEGRRIREDDIHIHADQF